MDDETTPSSATGVPPPASTASATGTTQDEAIAELKKAIALLNKKDTDIQIINAQYSKLNQEKANLEDNLIRMSNIKDQACHDVQDFTTKQIALEQEVHDAKVEQQRLIDLVNNEKQQQADA
ncbi:unnamed protein product, partial [Rotaria magnacalcarata]